MSETVAAIPTHSDLIESAPRRSRRTVRSLLTSGFALAAIGLIAVQVLSRCGFLLPQLSLFSHFQLQYLLASIGCGMFLLLLRSSRWAIVAAVAAILSGAQIVPLYFGGSDSTASPSIRILAANVWTCNPDHQQLIDLINREDPDVIALLEVDGTWMESLAVLQERYPHSLARTRSDNFGIGLISRLPLENTEIIDFIKASKPTIVADVVAGEQRFHLVVTHPMRPGDSISMRLRDEQMLAVSDYVQQHDGPIIVTGDLNTTMWTNIYRRLMRETELSNARKGFGIEPTWPSTLPPLARIPIDHLLHSNEIDIIDHRLGPNIGSDHLPLIVDIAISNSD